MDKKIFVTFLIALSVSGARARSVSSFTQVNDTIARDLSDLEAQLQDSVIPTDVDTNYYGVARQRNFNALKYVLDGRHRYPGDNFKTVVSGIIHILSWVHTAAPTVIMVPIRLLLLPVLISISVKSLVLCRPSGLDLVLAFLS